MKGVFRHVCLLAAAALVASVASANEVNFQREGKTDFTGLAASVVNATVEEVKFAVSRGKKNWDAYKLSAGSVGLLWSDSDDVKEIYMKLRTGDKDIVRALTLGRRYEIFFDDGNKRWDVKQQGPRK